MSKTLTVRQAAQVIFGRETVRDEHVRQVRFWLDKGDLEGCWSRHDWRVTEDAIACFMAAKAAESSFRMPATTKPVPATSPSVSREREARGQLSTTYRDALTNYFLAVVMRRRDRCASANWKRAVLFGQILFVALVMCLFIASLSSFGISFPSSPESEKIEGWLEAKFGGGGARLEEIGKPLTDDRAGNVVIRVKYSYESKHRGRIHTEQFFVLRAGEIVDVTSEL